MGRLSPVLLAAALRMLGFFTEPWMADREIHSVVGEPVRLALPAPIADPPAADAASLAHLNIVTWNIERGMAYEAILRTLRGLDADILLLQEVDRHCQRTGYRDVARDLADALQMNWVAAGEFQEIGEGRDGRGAITGQAILSRFPIEDARVLTFKAQDRWRWSINPAQPRRGGRMTLIARSNGLLLYNTHIESGGNAKLQRAQMAELLADHAHEAARATARAAAVEPALIAGDFNNGPVGHARMFANLQAAAFTDALGAWAGRTSTSRGSQHPIDWIFVNGVTAFSKEGRVVDAAAASDHSPVFAALSRGTAAALSR
jgi:endonuclease/exonuclease/phosphatase family metal-dependent hydrolase